MSNKNYPGNESFTITLTIQWQFDLSFGTYKVQLKQCLRCFTR